MGYFNPIGESLQGPGRRWSWVTPLIDIAGIAAGMVLIALLAMAIGVAFSPALGWASVFVDLLILVALALAVRNARRGQSMIAAGYLEQAVRLNLPLPAMVRAAELSERGRLRRKLVRLYSWLETGAPVGAAVQRALPGVPTRMVFLLLSAERLGQLPRMLRRLLREDRPLAERSAIQTILLRWYPMTMLAAVAVLGLGINLLIILKYQRILRDFHLEMPAITVWTMTVWRMVEFPLGFIAGLVLCGVVSRSFSELMSPPRPSRGPLSVITDRIAWVTPLWRTIVRGRGLADVCRLMADATEAGQPLDRALAEAADAATNRVLEKRLRQWSDLVSAGESADDAARKAGMPAMVVGMMRTARGTAALPAVFAFLGRYYDARWVAATTLAQSAAIPVMVLILALFVASLALAIFLPMVRMIDLLSKPMRLL